MTIANSLKYLSFMGLFLYMQLVLAQPDFKWDLELDVSIPFNVEGNREAMIAHYGEYVPIRIEVKNCGPRLGDYWLLLISVEIKLTVQGLELPLSSIDFGGASWWYNADEQIVGFGDIHNPCSTSLDSSDGPIIMAKVIDDENAYLTAEIVEYTYGGAYGLHPSVLSSYEIDSQPNNGVDTDGDGDFSNDPDDEDDGDGLYITDYNTRKPIRCSCEWESSDDPAVANPEVLEEAAEGSGMETTGGSGTVPRTSTGSGGALGGPSTPPPGPGGSLSAEAGCMIAADVPSPIPANPEGTGGVFRFDYHIESLARFSFIDDGRRKTEDLKVNYYVNSNDGSMFFSTETGGFFGANSFATADRIGEMHGVVWKADGQRVIYALERGTGTLRAVILAQDQTATDVAGQKFLNVTEFVNSMGSMTRNPDPLPPHLASKWGDVPGYIGHMNDVDGTKSTVTIYMGKSPDVAPIPTSSPLVGFLVGIFKDHIQANCNKLAVYTRMTLDSSDDFIEIELVNIRPVDFEFNGSPYKRTEMGAIPGSMRGNQLQAYNTQLETLMIRKEAAKTARRNCARNDTACYDRYTAEIEQLEQEQDAIECQIACEMGMEELYDDCNCN